MKILLIVILLISGLASCVYRKVERPVVTDNCLSQIQDSVSFRANVLPILTVNCAKPGCHTGNKPEGNLNLDADKAYSQLTSPFKGYMDTLNPENSVLYNSLTSPSKIMPPSGKLPDCEIETIMKWMGQNIKNN